MNSTVIKDYLDIAMQGISTFYIRQMTRYRTEYLMRKQNRDKITIVDSIRNKNHGDVQALKNRINQCLRSTEALALEK